MAARRVAKSAVDWAAFAERVPVDQKEAFRAFKAKSDMFVSRVHKYPENMPSIDWTFYKTRLANPALVDEFKKKFEAVSVPYPQDPSNMKANIDAQEKEAGQLSAKLIQELNSQIGDCKVLLEKVNSIPPLEEMTQEMLVTYFPETARIEDGKVKPSVWPHTKIAQPSTAGGTDPLELKPTQKTLGRYTSFDD